MRITENIRKSIFWALDFLKGSPIRAHYNEIKFLVENPQDPKAIEISQKNLKSLINHASSTTDFYKPYQDKSDLQDFPVINKTIVVENFEAVRSETFKNKKNYKASTGGSTGIPFKIWHDKNKRNRNTADTIYFSELANYEIGRKLVYLRLWVEKYDKNRMTSLIQNVFKHDVMDSSFEDIESLLTSITANSSAKTIMGYSSFLEHMCTYLKQADFDLSRANVTSIISIAEYLDEQTRKDLTTFFNTEVYSRYSNQENGIIAQQTKLRPNQYLINNGSYVVELLHPDKDEPAELGAWGRIVVTDLFNYCMPLLRYDTGDLGIVDQLDNGQLAIKDVIGRKFDLIYDTNDQVIIPHMFYIIWEYSDCKQFQFVQTDKGKYKFRLNTTPHNTDEAGATEFFKTILGEDAILDFEYIDEIPQLSSGKRQKVASNYVPNN